MVILHYCLPVAPCGTFFVVIAGKLLPAITMTVFFKKSFARPALMEKPLKGGFPFKAGSAF